MVTVTAVAAPPVVEELNSEGPCTGDTGHAFPATACGSPWLPVKLPLPSTLSGMPLAPTICTVLALVGPKYAAVALSALRNAKKTARPVVLVTKLLMLGALMKAARPPVTGTCTQLTPPSVDRKAGVVVAVAVCGKFAPALAVTSTTELVPLQTSAPLPGAPAGFT